MLILPLILDAADPGQTGSIMSEIARLHAASFEEAWDEKSIASLSSLPGSMIFIAREDNRLTGFILLRLAADEAEIITIAVDPAMRQRGTGRALLDAAIKAARKVGTMAFFLEVAVDNVAALALYTENGFVRVGQRRNYYRRGSEWVDADVLRRDLGSSV